MSRSNPRQENPAKKFIEWSGSEGEFYYYDKDKGENVKLKMPLYFMVLDQLNTVVGYSEEHKQGIFSNEVKDLSREKLNVRVYKKGTIEIGLWSEIKDAVKSQGGKFCKSVYALMLTKEKTELVCFKFTGSSFGGTENGGGWMSVNFNVEKDGVSVSEVIHGKKGATKYVSPVFKKVRVKPEHEELAIKVDEELQEYLKCYLSAPVVETPEEITDEHSSKTETEQAVDAIYPEFDGFPDASTAPDDSLNLDDDDEIPFL